MMNSVIKIQKVYILPRSKKGFPFRSLEIGIRNTAIPYIGNIQREVFPFKRLSEPFIFDVAVNMISRHQPTVPHSMNFFIIWIVLGGFFKIYKI